LFFCCVGTKNAKKIPSKQKRKVNISKLKDEKRKKFLRLTNNRIVARNIKHRKILRHIENVIQFYKFWIF
jgi:hypothetical protein